MSSLDGVIFFSNLPCIPYNSDSTESNHVIAHLLEDLWNLPLYFEFGARDSPCQAILNATWLSIFIGRWNQNTHTSSDSFLLITVFSASTSYYSFSPLAPVPFCSKLFTLVLGARLIWRAKPRHVTDFSDVLARPKSRAIAKSGRQKLWDSRDGLRGL